MSIPSLEFLVALLLLVTIFHAIPSASWRRGLLTICNFAFVWFTLPNNSSRLSLAVFAVSGFGAARLLQKKPRTGIFAIYIALLVAAFMILKKYDLIAAIVPARITDHSIIAVGLSYMLFRQIHFIVDVMQEQINQFTLGSYLNYEFNLFGFISGPIQRYQEFGDRWHEMSALLPDRYEVMRAYLRIVIGVIKVSAISAYFLSVFQAQRSFFLHPGQLVSLSRASLVSRFAVVFYGYLLFLYFNFSGYCDIVIAAAALVGIKMPENFDRPYLSRNVIDYWTRFHRSLGFWIRDYLFTPLYKSLATRWPNHAPSLVYPCYLVAFVLAGVWHGSTMNFLVFGILHGLGVSGVKVWESYLIRRFGRKGVKSYLASGPIRILAIALTLHFIAFTMLFFPGTVEEPLMMLRNFARAMGHQI